MGTQFCDTCVFFKLYSGREYGSCRATHPVFAGVRDGESGPDWYFPEVAEDEWCGDHKPLNKGVK